MLSVRCGATLRHGVRARITPWKASGTGDGGWDCSGLLRIDEVSRATGYDAPEGEYETLGGLVLTRLGRIPVTGDEVVLPNPRSQQWTVTESPDGGGWIARVERMDGRRIDRVRLIPVDADALATKEHSHG